MRLRAAADMFQVWSHRRAALCANLKRATFTATNFIWETIYRADGGQMVTNDVFDSDRLQTVAEINDYHAPDSASKNVAYTISRSTKSSQKANLLRNRTAERRNTATWQWNDSIQTKGTRATANGPARTADSSPLRVARKEEQEDGVNRKSKSNAYRKSTYLIDINRSSDSDSTNNDISGGGFEHNDHIYFNDYSVQIHAKDHKPKLQPHNARGKEKEALTQHTTMPMQDHDVVGLEREDFFGSTQEIITFAEEGTQYRKYRIVEFAPQKARVPNQKISIRSAQMHIRIEKQPNEWDARAEAQHQIQQTTMKGKRKNHANAPRQRIKIWVFRMTEGINITEKAIDQAFLFRASFEVDTDHLGWQKFDLTETIREWYRDATGENLRLLIDCTGCGSQYSLHLFQWSAPNAYTKMKTGSGHVNPNRPFLVLHTESTRPRRVRRRAVDCGGALSGQCCKESFYVSFKALGWDDWIIAPRGYFANYCRGECTGPFRTPDTFQTFHAHFIEEYRKMGLLNGMRPCCAPIKFSSMSLIYYGDDGIIKRDLPKMVVDECGCP
ncbi:inhibin beta chain isoform X2 [Drosophila novamexicana]|uniref:inhibin beta chain isoform X2 n=1 Tax=Drosophila novamexicana TaxID=47314 RepID=UPI0011E5FA5E|nr:inhibin beta chain isoform X2 [Drosophila novamexicana]